MKAVIQRVSHASVTIDARERREIGKGLVCFFCACAGDRAEEADRLAEKTAKLRIFSDAGGKLNLSAEDLWLDCLVVSNFTLAADSKSGNRPSFTNAAEPNLAKALYERFVTSLRCYTVKNVVTGEFGADMKVELENDGPVTIILDTAEWNR